MSEEQPQDAQAPEEPAKDELEEVTGQFKQQLSEEEEKIAQQMAEVAAIANRLVAHDSRYTHLVSSMLASRQLYAMCLYELERLCGDTDFKKATKVEDEPDLGVGKELPEQQLGMLKEILINSAAVQAQQPFEESQLFTGMVNTVFPWMRDVVQLHNELQAKERKRQFEEHEKERIAKKISFNVQIFPEEGKDTGFWVGREKPLLFAGWEPALRWLMDHITIEALKQGNNVEQILRLNVGGKPKHSDPKIWYVPKNDWNAIAETTTAFQKLYQSNVMTNLIAPVDLLIVDDLTHACNSSTFSSLPNIANEAQKKFKRWAGEAGCLLVGCLPYDRQLKPNELNLPDYETLRMHNILRGVSAIQAKIDGQDWYKIQVGQYEVARVPVEEVDAYRTSNIIQP